MVSRSDPGSFQRTTTCIWMPDVRLLHYFEPTQWGSVSGLDDGKRKTKRGWSPGDSLNLVRVLSVRVNYSQQCRNDINGRWEYSKSIMKHFSYMKINFKMSTKWPPFCPGLHVDGLVQERRNSIANALQLRLFCTNPSMCQVWSISSLSHWRTTCSILLYFELS